MVVNKDKLRVIKTYLDGEGLTNREFAEKLGVSPQAVGSWLREEKNISRSNWVSIREIVKEYMPDAQPHVSPEQIRRDLKAAGHTIIELSEFSCVPVVSFAQAAGFDPILEPLDSLLNDPIGTAMFRTKIEPGMFAIRIEGESMVPMIPSGSIALVDSRMGQFPKTGKPCVAKLDTGQVICKIWSWRNGTIKLTSINPECDSYEWTKAQAAGRLQWRYPIVELSITL